ncbi:MAG: RNA polymerase sigma factor [Bryobacteraceae bacterium]|nr:RNA polymerase sigma factor [Bryobacteraceae bacterium]
MSDTEFQIVFEAHQDAVFGFAWRMTGSPAMAEDVAQETFLALLKSPGSYSAARGSLRSWLLGVARNLILKRWRADGRWTQLDEDYTLAEPAAPDWQMQDRVAHAVRSLSPLQREVVILVEYEGMTLEETARAVDTEVGTVKARLHRARTNLRTLLEPLRSIPRSANP